MHIGTAGWSIPRQVAASFPGEGQHLQRYARVLNAVEINSSFYRSHRFEQYEKWAASTPPHFRFAVKLPQSITHDGRLRRARAGLEQFLSEAAGLGTRLAVVLVQLPPSLPFEARPVRSFFSLLKAQFHGSVVCEPRHASWFTARANDSLSRLEVSRAAVDPAPWPGASHPGGWMGAKGDGAGAVLYHRWHGSPRMYWSRYEQPWLAERARHLRQWPLRSDRWCIFDNTAGGWAAPNALELQGQLARRSAR